MRAMTRIFGVSRNTVLAWLKKSRTVAGNVSKLQLGHSR